MSDDIHSSGDEQAANAPETTGQGLPVPDQPVAPSEPAAPPLEQQAAQAAPEPGPVTVSRPKQPINPGLLVLGLITPWIAAFLAGALANALSLVGLPAPGLSAVAAVIPLAVLIGVIAAFVRGRATGNAGLRSFGLGGIISYVVTMLLSLLAFGACFVTGVFQL